MSLRRGFGTLELVDEDGRPLGSGQAFAVHRPNSEWYIWKETAKSTFATTPASAFEGAQDVPEGNTPEHVKDNCPYESVSGVPEGSSLDNNLSLSQSINEWAYYVFMVFNVFVFFFK